MARPEQPLPHSVTVILEGKREGKRAAYESLTPEERAEADEWQRAYREACRARTAAKAEANRDRDSILFKMGSEGETVADIATAMNSHVRRVYKLLESKGITIGSTVARRWRRFWLSAEADAALHRLAHDAGLSIPAMLERIGEVLLSDDAHVARRELRIGRRPQASGEAK